MAKQVKRKMTRRKIQTPKECYFCVEKKDAWYSDTSVLSRFVTDRGKIMGRLRTGFCALHQRQLTSAIKHARHLALMAFVVRD